MAEHTTQAVAQNRPTDASISRAPGFMKRQTKREQAELTKWQTTFGNQAIQRSLATGGSGVPFLQRKCAACAKEEEGLNSGVMQTKLVINKPGDAFEQEADRVARAVMSGDFGRTSTGGTVAPQVQRSCACGGTCDDCQKKVEVVQRVARSSPAAVGAAPQIVHEVLRSPGQPLDTATRTFMESRFEADFRGVRVHTGTKAAESARSVNARAFTVGKDIVFDDHAASNGGALPRELVAHELVHVMQQSSARKAPGLASPGDARFPNASDWQTSGVREYPLHEMVGNFLQRAEGPCPDVATPHKLLKKDMVDPGVREVQRKLNLFDATEKALGNSGVKNAPLDEDCIYGPLTFAAVFDFQKQKFADPKEHDGEVGDHTWAELDKISGTPTPLPALPAPADPTDPLSRIKNVNLTFGVKPGLKRQGAAGGRVLQVTLDDFVKVLGSADVVGGTDCDKFKFGFIQMCRPFGIHQVTYHSPSSGGDFDIDESATIRSNEPQLDVFNVGDVFSESEDATAQASRCARRSGLKRAFTLFSDKPSTGFALHPRITDDFFITGLAWQNFFFTAFSVQVPDGTIRHLQSFFWDIKYCETFGPPTPGQPLGPSLAKTPQVNIGPPANGASDGDFLRLAGRPAANTCNAVVKAATTLNVRGPGVSPVVCPIP
jgi:hypothetical protein